MSLPPKLALAAKNTPSQTWSWDAMFDPFSEMGCSHQILTPPSGRARFQNTPLCSILKRMTSGNSKKRFL
jgi:hypothetical protein